MRTSNFTSGISVTVEKCAEFCVWCAEFARFFCEKRNFFAKSRILTMLSKFNGGLSQNLLMQLYCKSRILEKMPQNPNLSDLHPDFCCTRQQASLHRRVTSHKLCKSTRRAAQMYQINKLLIYYSAPGSC